LRYNLYESRFARLDRNQVLGREFFGEVAPCTAVESFGGRFQRMVSAGSDVAAEHFDFTFDFKFGAQQVSVEIIPFPAIKRYYLLINRQAVGKARLDPPEGGFAVLQSALAPDEAAVGVRRDTLERRFVEVPWSLLAALRSTCERLAPESWQVFCTEWGVQWGRRMAIDLASTALETQNAALRELSMRDVTDLVAESIAGQGWGRPTFDFAAAREGLLIIEVARSVLAEAAPGRAIKRPSEELTMACHLLAGAISAVFSNLAGRRLVAREVACKAAGAPTCSFVLVAASRRATLDEALKKGNRGVDAMRAALLRAPATREDA